MNFDELVEYLSEEYNVPFDRYPTSKYSKSRTFSAAKGDDNVSKPPKRPGNFMGDSLAEPETLRMSGDMFPDTKALKRVERLRKARKNKSR